MSTPLHDRTDALALKPPLAVSPRIPKWAMLDRCSMCVRSSCDHKGTIRFREAASPRTELTLHALPSPFTLSITSNDPAGSEFQTRTDSHPYWYPSALSTLDAAVSCAEIPRSSLVPPPPRGEPRAMIEAGPRNMAEPSAVKPLERDMSSSSRCQPVGQHVLLWASNRAVRRVWSHLTGVGNVTFACAAGDEHRSSFIARTCKLDAAYNASRPHLKPLSQSGAGDSRALWKRFLTTTPG